VVVAAIMMCTGPCLLGAGNCGIEGECYAKLPQGGRTEREKVTPQYSVTGQARDVRERTMSKKS